MEPLVLVDRPVGSAGLDGPGFGARGITPARAVADPG